LVIALLTRENTVDEMLAIATTDVASVVAMASISSTVFSLVDNTLNQITPELVKHPWWRWPLYGI
jgi:hypothetical protein